MNDQVIIETMRTYGGKFVRALAEAALRAGPVNFQRIKATWPDYWQTYAEMAERKNIGSDL